VGIPDTTPPIVQIDPPQNTNPGIDTFTGSVTDDESDIRWVRVRVRRDADNLWFNGTDWVNTTTGSWQIPTGVSNWSIDFPLTQEGSYLVQGLARDNENNLSSVEAG